MPSQINVKMHQSECDYCIINISLFPPYNNIYRNEFWAPCPRDHCKKVTRYYFINGTITSKDTPQKFRFYSELKAEGGIKAEIADNILEACETAYFDKYKGAAIVLRRAAELFTLTQLLKMQVDREDLPHFQEAIENIRDKKEELGLRRDVINEIIENLKYIKNLGDTAAHPRIKEEKRILPEKGSFDKARRNLEKIIKNTYGW